MVAMLDPNTPAFTQLAKTIDHSLLKPELTEADIASGCELARRYDVASVCVKPCGVSLAARLLAGSGVKVGTVVGFPHGSSTTATKVFEAQDAVANGAEELDMVINIGALRSGHDDLVQADIHAVVAAAGRRALVKVILENCFLSDDEKVRACRLAEEAGAHFVKTSTGFAPGGATLADVKLMRASVGPNVGVKAAGGIRDLPTVLGMLAAGATRIGISQTAAILEAFRGRP